MKTNRLSAKLNKALNDQMTLEAYSAQVYLALSSWADSQSYAGISSFLFKHAVEEREHMVKLIEYIQERGGNVTIEAIDKPSVKVKSVQECIEAVFKQEVANTTAIYKIVKLAMEEEDWATWNHLQWFVREQREEEKFALQLLDKVKIAGGEKATIDALYTFDSELGHRKQDTILSDDMDVEG